MNLILAAPVLERVGEHARRSLPDEGCGLIAGMNGVGDRFIPITNTLAGGTAFEMDPSQLISALRAIRESGEDLVAIYHSHPCGPAEPSRRDIERAYYPEAVHLIVSLAEAERPVFRAFRILEGEVFEVELRAIV